MNLISDSFEDNGLIPGKCAFAVKDERMHIQLSENKNPHLAWSDLPAGTRSLALICHDPDAPSTAENANKEGLWIEKEVPRVVFCHWALVDLAPDSAAIAEGEFSNGVVAHGKKGPAGPRGTRQGVNDYTKWFAGDEKMAGNYFGYDGPCPPWNDKVMHHYIFTLYALKIAKVPVEGAFTGLHVLKAIKDHVLGAAIITGQYSLNPGVRVK